MSHILILSWKDIHHPKSGGAEKVMFAYAKELVLLWHEVTWFGSAYTWGKDKEVIEGIQIFRKYSLYTIYFLGWLWYRKFVKTHKVDFIIDEAGGIPLLSPLFLKGRKILFFIHHIWDKEWDYFFPFPLNIIFKFFIKKVISLYRDFQTITVSDSTKKELIKDFWFAPDDVFVIENTLSKEEIPAFETIPKKQNIVLFVGRLMPIKNVGDTIEIFSIFQKKYHDFQLQIIGNSQDENYTKLLKEKVKKLSLESSVSFLPYSKETLTSSLLVAKYLLVTSLKEWFWLVVLEANAYAIPAFWYAVSGLDDAIIEWINWVKVPFWEVEMLASKLGTFESQSSEYQKISQSSFKYISKRKDWKEKTEQLLQILYS